MRREITFSLVALFAVGLTFAQQPVQLPAPPQANANAATPKVAVPLDNPGVIAPELLPVEIPLTQAKNCEKLDGAVTLSAVVDSTGHPQNIYLLDPHRTDLDKLALIVANADRFKPGTQNGVPAAVALAIEIKMQTCVEDVPKSKTGGYTVRFRSLPLQNLLPPSKNSPATVPGPAPVTNKARVSPPVVTRDVEAQYSDDARKKKINGICIVSLIVDANGMPQHVQIVKSLEPTLDQKALEAVSQYRFKPAKKNGVPVPVTITIGVDFHLF